MLKQKLRGKALKLKLKDYKARQLWFNYPIYVNSERVNINILPNLVNSYKKLLTILFDKSSTK